MRRYKPQFRVLHRSMTWGRRKAQGCRRRGARERFSLSLRVWEAVSERLKQGGEWRAAQSQPHPPRAPGARAIPAAEGWGAGGARTLERRSCIPDTAAPNLERTKRTFFELRTVLVNGIASHALASRLFIVVLIPRCFPSRTCWGAIGSPSARQTAVRTCEGGRRPPALSPRSPRPAAQRCSPGVAGCAWRSGSAGHAVSQHHPGAVLQAATGP